MFFDWLSIYQDHPDALPLIADRHFIAIDSVTGEDLGITQPTLEHSGSYSTSIRIRVSGNRVTVTGNPSRVNRLDNLFGFSTLDQCVDVYNDILKSYGLPPFTKATKRWQGVGEDGSKVRIMTDGAVFTEMHVTSNLTTGKNNADTFIKAISTLSYRNSIPRLHTNGKTCDWLTKKGKGSSLIYPSVYNKAYELQLHTMPKIKKTHGIDSDEYKYLEKVVNYCEQNGVARFEQKLKSAFLRRNDLNFYGFEDIQTIRNLHTDFLNIHRKMKVEAMTLESITQQLVNYGVCPNTRSANATTIYAIQWMHGQTFDLNKKQVKVHRARLRQIGIDIARPCDITKFSMIVVKEAKEIRVGHLMVPRWYKRANTQLARAA